MHLRRARVWLSVAVLVVQIAAPLRGIKFNAGVSDPEIMPGSVWTRGCDDVQRDGTRHVPITGETTPVGQSCSMGSSAGVVLAEAAELTGEGMRAEKFDASLDALESGDRGRFKRAGSAPVTFLLGELDALPPDEKPTGAKVPEPTTFLLLGGGMIAASRVSRIKTRPKSLLRAIAARSNGPQLHSASGN